MRRFVLLVSMLTFAACDVDPSVQAPEAAEPDRVGPPPVIRALTQRVAALEADQVALRTDYKNALATVQLRQDDLDQRVTKLETRTTDLESSFRTLDAQSTNLAKLVEGLGLRASALEKQLTVIEDEVDWNSKQITTVGADVVAQTTAVADLGKRLQNISDDVDLLVQFDKQVQVAIGAPWFADDADSASVGHQLTELRQFTGVGIVEDDVDYGGTLTGKIDGLGTVMQANGSLIRAQSEVNLLQGQRLDAVEDDTSWLEQQVLSLWDAVFPAQP